MVVMVVTLLPMQAWQNTSRVTLARQREAVAVLRVV